MVITTKSRNLPLGEFYSILQKEYISYYVRSKIYPEGYAEKYRGYCLLKYDKIMAISTNNSLPSIFTNAAYRNMYISDFINAYGLPNFEYRDDVSLKIMGRWDKMYWFGAGVSVQIKLDNFSGVSTVIKNFGLDLEAVVEFLGVTRRIPYSCLSRLVANNLFDFPDIDTYL